MADYLCRVRIDRAALDENMLLQGEGTIETARFYVKLSEDVDVQPDQPDYDTVESFNTFLYSGTNLESLRVQALLDAMKAANTLSETVDEEEEVTAANGYACPLCTDIRLAAGKEPIYLNDSNVNKHIKTCGKCHNYYCDGGEVIDNVTDDGVIVYPETHKKHYNESVAAGGEGHYPEDAIGIKTPKLVAMEEIIGKSLLRQFCMYCLKLDEDPNYASETGYYSTLNSYLKIYPTNTSYLSYKYQVGEEDGGYTLRLKVEVSPCDYFLTRKYHTIYELSKEVSEFLSYTVIPDKPEVPEQPDVPVDPYTPEVVNEEMTIPSARIEGDELFDDNLDLEF